MGLAVLARRRASSFPGPLPSIPQEVARAIEPPAAHKILQTLAAGVVCGFLAVVMSLSLGNLLFFGVMHDSVPIALGMAWPDRVPEAAPGLDWTTAATWTFEPLDDAAFPAVALAREAAAAGGTMPAVYNAANEACVALFLEGRIGFTRIVDTVARIVSEHDAARAAVTSVADVLAVDGWARRRVAELLA